jgi:hypothetical protein
VKNEVRSAFAVGDFTIRSQRPTVGPSQVARHYWSPTRVATIDRHMNRRIGMLALMAIALAPPAPAAAQTDVLHAVAWADCAPWDGPAFTVVVGQPGSKVDPEHPWLGISIWHPVESRHGVTYHFPDTDGTTGAVSYGGKAFPSSTGTVSFAADTMKNDVDGSFDLVTPSGRRLIGRFHGSWVPRKFMCGRSLD